jgi:hypothetical protein
MKCPATDTEAQVTYIKSPVNGQVPTEGSSRMYVQSVKRRAQVQIRYSRYQKQPQCSRAFPSTGSTPQNHHVAVGRCNITDRQSLSAQSTATMQQALAQRPQRNSAAAETSHEQMVQCVSCAGGRQGKEESGSHKNRCNNQSTAKTTSTRKT